MKQFSDNQFIVNNSTSNLVNPFAAVAINTTNSSVLVGDRNTSVISDINFLIRNRTSQIPQLIFDRLKLILGDDFFNGANNQFFTNGGNPFTIGNTPVGNGNRDFGNDNATIGNFNSDYGNINATIGNGNWNFGTNNTTIGNGNWNFGSDNTNIGNGNWYWDYVSNNFNLGNGNWYFDSDNATVGNGNWNFGSDNTTIGNGNWYWDYVSNNSTLGNGNWYFGNDNTTIGNGNWDFGNNNTIIGNGNWVFTSGNTVIGNGNWLVDSDNTSIGTSNNTEGLELFLQVSQPDIDNLINSLVRRIGQDFMVLTDKFDTTESETFNRLILSRSSETNNGNISTDIEQFLKILSIIPSNQIPYQPGQNVQSVPEPTSSMSLILFGCVCWLFLRRWRRKETRKDGFLSLRRSQP
jgi:hypothetical protein